MCKCVYIHVHTWCTCSTDGCKNDYASVTSFPSLSFFSIPEILPVQLRVFYDHEFFWPNLWLVSFSTDTWLSSISWKGMLSLSLRTFVNPGLTSLCMYMSSFTVILKYSDWHSQLNVINLTCCNTLVNTGFQIQVFLV